MLFPKVSIAALLVALKAKHASAQHHPNVTPQRVAFSSLLQGHNNVDVFMGGLTEDGIISITSIPSFRETKKALMSNLHGCIMDMGEEDIDVPTQRFQDGTIRRSFATSTLPAGGAQPIKSLEEFERQSADHPKSESCQRFRDHVVAFRSAVDLATTQFAERLSAEMCASLPKPLLSSSAPSSNSAGGERNYDDIKQVVAAGEQLEHFHSYQKGGSAAADEETTIEFHTDQGFFIAFTPGLIVSSSEDHQVELSDGFYVQDSNGEKVMMEFTEEDDLVFMMGDGVNQFVRCFSVFSRTIISTITSHTTLSSINNKIVDDHKALRATPHALTLPVQQDTSKVRVWYGRMALPPNDAYYPSMDSTFGEARQFLVDSSSKGDGVPMGIGCSSPNMKAVIQTSRHLDGPEDELVCAEDELFCWYRCMKLDDPYSHGMPATSCEERKLGLQCVGARGEVIHDGKKHGDYYPLCTNSTNVTNPFTDYPQIDQQDEDVCPGLWPEFHGDDWYDHMIELTSPGGPESFLSWSIVEDDTGAKKIKARLAFDGVFGWLAMGFADADGKHNGMNGGNVILAIPGGNYAMDSGLDASEDPSIGTYVISPEQTAFRHWQTPIETDETKTTLASFETTDCFTAITFESDHINGKKFNFTGTDEMIWAGNGNDAYMGYHGYGNRKRFTIDWMNGDVHNGHDHGSHDHVHSSDDHGSDDGDGVNKMNDGSIKSIVLGMYTSFAFAAMAQYLYVN
ncbi:hypothetical protein ACHAXR_010646 [Thalassiosira sp. AJA248-18]